MKTLATFTPYLEVYSIDEAFADLSHIPRERLCAYGHEIREAVWRCTGIPVSVGIATTKTLSKIATEIVKKNPRHQDVLSLIQSTEEELDEELASIVLKDVWGIGSRYTHRLQASRSIFTAKDLKDADEHWICKRFSVTVQRSVLQPPGIACTPGRPNLSQKKGIMTAKSFGRPVNFACGVGRSSCNVYRTRRREVEKRGVRRFLHQRLYYRRILFQQDALQYANSLSRWLPFQSAFTPDFLNVALDIVRSLYQPGFSYKKAGVFLS